ncbi:hypothetical protein EV426DRAFT_401262 [Tirmania nivea]|nr:hypothetical protein EV426DRAFT_401262 [Tirmania nivea]
MFSFPLLLALLCTFLSVCVCILLYSAVSAYMHICLLVSCFIYTSYTILSRFFPLVSFVIGVRGKTVAGRGGPRRWRRAESGRVKSCEGKGVG